jgi:DNA polymerase-3 subunit epsilon
MLDWLRTGDAALDESRWIVLDIEATGRDATRDRLIAIAAIALRIDGANARIAFADSFDAVLPNDADFAALDAFADWVGRSPLLAFHASFVRTLLDRAFDAAFGHRLPAPSLDVEHLAEVLHPEVAARSLDEWMAHFGIVCALRHDAAADALATAELLLKLWPDVVRSEPEPRFAAVAKLAAQRRWTRLIKR